MLGLLVVRRVKRMRSPTLIKQINALTPGDYKKITLARPGPAPQQIPRPRVRRGEAEQALAAALRQRLPGYATATTVPWWGNRTLRYQFA